ncbi:hypothetical protein AB0H69_45715 [Streptomyces phaeochromogenes]
MAVIAICLLAVGGHTGPIAAVALFDGTVFAGGTIVNVTVHIRR